MNSRRRIASPSRPSDSLTYASNPIGTVHHSEYARGCRSWSKAAVSFSVGRRQASFRQQTWQWLQWRSAQGRYCCKSRFSPMTKILRAVGATFAYKMRGTSRPPAKFTGDFGSAIEVIRISDRSLLSVFAKNLEPCNFRLLQHNRPLGDISSHRLVRAARANS